MPKIMGVIIEWMVCICVLWGISFLSTLLHELGHAVSYMLSTGDRHWHIRVGSGKKLLETKALSVKLLVWDGCFAPAEDRMDTKGKWIVTLSGGPVVSLALAAALLLLRFGNASFSSGIFAAGAVEFFVPNGRPSREAAVQIAREQFALCHERVLRLTKTHTLAELVDTLTKSCVWYLGWSEN